MTNVPEAVASQCVACLNLTGGQSLEHVHLDEVAVVVDFNTRRLRGTAGSIPYLCKVCGARWDWSTIDGWQLRTGDIAQRG